MKTIEQALDEIVYNLVPEVVGNGWVRKFDLTDGTKIYELRVKDSERKPQWSGSGL